MNKLIKNIVTSLTFGLILGFLVIIVIDNWSIQAVTVEQGASGEESLYPKILNNILEENSTINGENSGVVNLAGVADQVLWSGVNSKPTMKCQASRVRIANRSIYNYDGCYDRSTRIATATYSYYNSGDLTAENIKVSISGAGFSITNNTCDSNGVDLVGRARPSSVGKNRCYIDIRGSISTNGTKVAYIRVTGDNISTVTSTFTLNAYNYVDSWSNLSCLSQTCTGGTRLQSNQCAGKPYYKTQIILSDSSCRYSGYGPYKYTTNCTPVCGSGTVSCPYYNVYECATVYAGSNYKTCPPKVKCTGMVCLDHSIKVNGINISGSCKFPPTPSGSCSCEPGCTGNIIGIGGCAGCSCSALCSQPWVYY